MRLACITPRGLPCSSRSAPPSRLPLAHMACAPPFFVPCITPAPRMLCGTAPFLAICLILLAVWTFSFLVSQRKRALSHGSGVQALAGGSSLPKQRRKSTAPRKAKDNWEQDCEQVLESLKKHSKHYVFAKPVDVPGYSLRISEPMDLGTIKSKLDKQEYMDSDGFYADLNKVWENCKEFNGADSPYTKWAMEMKEMARKGMKRTDREDSEKKYFRKEIYRLRKVVSSLQQQQQLLLQPPVPVEEHEWTFEEKRRLTESINKLGSGDLQQVVKILNKNGSTSSTSVELDLAKVESSVLSKLKAFVKKCAQKKQRARNKPRSSLPNSRQIEEARMRTQADIDWCNSQLGKAEEVQANSVVGGVTQPNGNYSDPESDNVSEPATDEYR